MLRPIPKWERIQPLMPSIEDKTVLETGCSCGFFSLNFCTLGASSVTGIDIVESNIEKATFCATVLQLSTVVFSVGDVGLYRKKHDVVFMTSVFEHFIYPFYYLTRLLCLAREMLVIDTYHRASDDEDRLCRLNVEYLASSSLQGHTFVSNFSYYFSKKMLMDFLAIVGVGQDQIEQKLFFDDSMNRRYLTCIHTRKFQQDRRFNPWIQQFRDIEE